jgi:hypothetical protein
MRFCAISGGRSFSNEAAVSLAVVSTSLKAALI